MRLCPACGMNSRTDDVCERCRIPFRTAPDPTMIMNPQPQTVRRVSLTGEVVETTQAMPTMHPPGALPPQQAGPGGLYGPGGPPAVAVPRTNAGPVMPPGAYSAAAVREQLGEEGPPIGERWEKALAIAMPILAVSMLIAHFAPSAIYGLVFGSLLVIPLVLGALKAIPTVEDAIVDASIAFVIAVLLGPLVALGGYLLLAMVKQECNPAIVALLGLNVLVRGLFGIAFAPVADTASLTALWGFFNWASIFGVVLSFSGWLLSSFFRGIE